MSSRALAGFSSCKQGNDKPYGGRTRTVPLGFIASRFGTPARAVAASGEIVTTPPQSDEH